MVNAASLRARAKIKVIEAHALTAMDMALNGNNTAVRVMDAIWSNLGALQESLTALEESIEELLEENDE